MTWFSNSVSTLIQSLIPSHLFYCNWHLPSSKFYFPLIHSMYCYQISSFEDTAFGVLFLCSRFFIDSCLFTDQIPNSWGQHSKPSCNVSTQTTNSIFTYFFKWDFCPIKISFLLSWAYSMLTLFQTASLTPCTKEWPLTLFSVCPTEPHCSIPFSKHTVLWRLTKIILTHTMGNIRNAE